MLHEPHKRIWFAAERPDLIKKSGPASASSTRPNTGAGPETSPKISASRCMSAIESSGTVIKAHGALGVVMNGRRNEFLAGAAFTPQQDVAFERAICATCRAQSASPRIADEAAQSYRRRRSVLRKYSARKLASSSSRPAAEFTCPCTSDGGYRAPSTFA